MAHSKNERAELEMRITRYRQLSAHIADNEVRERFEAKITELEQKLRGIDQ
jgi:hypothetical protein